MICDFSGCHLGYPSFILSYPPLIPSYFAILEGYKGHIKGLKCSFLRVRLKIC